ncbi:MAG TPA: AAA family ATPase [Gemmataceae bacterium]|jgi:predicted ABC-type ATPase
MTDSPPTVIVLGGPNGAGKSTAARTLLAETLRIMTFVNADVIAQGLAGFDPDSAAIEASRIMLERLHSLAEQRADFAFETTLAGYSRGLAGQTATNGLCRSFALLLVG